MSGIVPIWENENPHQLCEYERVTPKVNVWLGMHTNSIIGPFFFVEKTVTGHVYRDMLENCTVLQIPPGFLFQQDGAPPHHHGDVTAFLNKTFGEVGFNCLSIKVSVFDSIRLFLLEDSFRCV
ncbi:DUF4817 domain-containing protein [Trichonephila clavata]|uniref:DUF4817 domain-containing protein n=1 Tax=Trichonephila clavata TaxID=2740835 RepID=A0A8X6FX33_TRICU|nr:DUF4817 domain-containing protein [Trichonephila clavata]